MKIKTKDIKAYRKAYYVVNREKILNRAKAAYHRRTTNKCKGCGVDIKELLDSNNAHFRYCNACIGDKNKTSRQARWYRLNSFRLKLKRKSQRRDKK